MRTQSCCCLQAAKPYVAATYEVVAPYLPSAAPTTEEEALANETLSPLTEVPSTCNFTDVTDVTVEERSDSKVTSDAPPAQADVIAE